MLGDLHIHMLLDGVYYRAAIDAHRSGPNDRLIRERLEDYRSRDIRFLRDGGDAWGVGLRARELAGEYGIDYRSPAFPIHKNGHYGAFIGRGFDTFDDYRRLLDAVRAEKGDFVKLMISGLIDFSKAETLTEESLSPEEIVSMVDAAHDAGFAVMVHANGDSAVSAAVSAGAESVEHGAYLSEAVLLQMAKSRTVWVPTLSTIGNLIGSGRFPDAVLKALLSEQQKKIAFAAANGGSIGLGSDAGAYRVCHGQAACDEYAYLRAALGDGTDAILSAAEATIQNVFSSV